MDTKRLMTSVLFAAGLMLIFFYFNRMNSAPAGVATSPIFVPVERTFQVKEAGATADTVTLGNATKDEKVSKPTMMELTINPATAGIERVRLSVARYAASYKRDEPLTLTIAGAADQAKPFSTLGVHVMQGGKELRLPWVGYKMQQWRENPGRQNTAAQELFKKDFTSLVAAEQEQVRVKLDGDERDSYANVLFPQVQTAAGGAPVPARKFGDLSTTDQATVLLRIHNDETEFPNACAIIDAQYLWKKVRQTETEADFLMTFTDSDGRAVAEITKSFRIDPASYEVVISHTIRNLLAAHSVSKPAAEKSIELGQKGVSNVVVKVGDAVKAAGKDYTVDGAEGRVTVAADGSIKGTDTVEVSFNTAADTLGVRIDQLGPTNLNRDDPQTDDRFFHTLHLDSAKNYVNEDGFNLIQSAIRKSANGTGTILVGGPGGQFSDFAHDPQLWVASSNRFFTMAVRPLPESVSYAGIAAPEAAAPATSATAAGRPAGWAVHKLYNGHGIDEPHHIDAAAVDLMKVGLKAADDVSVVRFAGRLVEVPAGGSVTEPLTVYMGPKDRVILNGDINAPEGSPAYNFAVYHYIKLIQFQQGCYSYCISNAVIMPILASLDFLKGHVAWGNYGIAIMILVVVVRACLHPLTRASQINMAKMGKQMRDVAPKIEAMKKRYADDKKKQSEETMRIYRENNINPAGGILGCLPMLIQMPIWAALYSGLRNDIDLRHAAFIPGWMNDLASPDTILPSAIPVLGHPIFSLPLVGDIYGLNLLPILLAGVFFIQMKVTSASQPKPADEQQAQMQKMSQYMIFLFPLFLYNAPSGLNLYIFASTMAGLLDTYLVRKSLKKQGILPASAETLPTHESQ